MLSTFLHRTLLQGIWLHTSSYQIINIKNTLTQIHYRKAFFFFKWLPTCKNISDGALSRLFFSVFREHDILQSFGTQSLKLPSRNLHPPTTTVNKMSYHFFFLRQFSDTLGYPPTHPAKSPFHGYTLLLFVWYVLDLVFCYEYYLGCQNISENITLKSQYNICAHSLPPIHMCTQKFAHTFLSLSQQKGILCSLCMVVYGPPHNL